MAASAGTAFVQVRPDLKGFGRDLASGISGAGSAISGFGSSLTRSVSAPIVAATGLAGAFGIKSAVSFEQAQTAFENLLPAGADVVGYMKELSDFAAASPFDVTSINKAATGLLGVGVAAGDVLPLLSGMGDAVAGFGGSAADVEMVNYAMKQVIGSGRAYTADINQIATYVPTIWQEVAAQMGVSVDEARKMASEGQITSDVLVKAFNEPIGPLQNLAGSMEAQAGTLQGVWSTFTDTVGAQLTQAILPLLPQIKTAIGDLGAAIGPALQAAVPAFIDLGNAMVPLIGKVADLLTWFSQLSPQMQQWIVYAVAGAAAAGPLVRVVGGVVSAVGGMAKAFGAVGGGIVKFVGFAGKIVGVFRSFGMIKGVVVLFNILKLTVVTSLRAIGLAFLTNPVGLLITAIVVVIAGAAFLIWKYWDQIKAAFQAAIAWITPIVQQIWSTIVGVFTSIWNAIKGVFDAIVGAFQAVWGIIVGVFNTIVGVFQAIIAVVVPIWNTFFAIITLPIRIWWAVVSAVFQLAWAFIQWVFETIVGFVAPIWQALWDTVKSVLSAAWGVISGALSAAWNFIVGVFNGIKSAVLTVWNALWGAVRSVWDSVYGFLSSGVGRARDVLVGAFETARDKIKSIWDKIKSIVQGAIDAVAGIAQGMWNGLKGALNTGIGLLNSAIRGFNAVISAVNKVPGVSVPTIPTIPKLAEGGVVTRPTVAMVGEGRESEAVLPLSKLDAMLGRPAQERQDVYLQVKIGDRDITEMIESVRRRDERALAASLARGRRL